MAKTIKEQFDESRIYNIQHQLFCNHDDDFFGKRIPGGFIKDVVDEGHDCQLIIFDNCDRYLYDIEERTLYRSEKLPEDLFILKYIEKFIYDFCDVTGIGIRNPFYCGTNEIDAMPLIRLLINREEQVIYITNILIPIEKKHHNYGKDLIAGIYNICHKLGFRLLLLDVVPHFLEALIRRKAQVVEYDTLEIVEETDLSSHFH